MKSSVLILTIFAKDPLIWVLANWGLHAYNTQSSRVKARKQSFERLVGGEKRNKNKVLKVFYFSNPADFLICMYDNSFLAGYRVLVFNVRAGALSPHQQEITVTA